MKNGFCGAITGFTLFMTLIFKQGAGVEICMTDIQRWLKVIFHAMSQISFCSIRKMLQVTFLIKMTAQIVLIQATIVCHTEDQVCLAGTNTNNILGIRKQCKREQAYCHKESCFHISPGVILINYTVNNLLLSCY